MKNSEMKTIVMKKPGVDTQGQSNKKPTELTSVVLTQESNTNLG
jgi:hypothetical protein